METREQEEKEFHNKIRNESLKENQEEYNELTANKKFYLINRQSRDFVNSWLLKNCQGKKVLDYCCGNGETAIFLAKNGIEVVGIDISEISIANCINSSQKEGVAEKASFLVMDAEATKFPENDFDVVVCLGVLHHLDTERAFREIARVLKPNGIAFCDEPLVYNPVFQLYRRMTPKLRTKWETEHILSKKDIRTARKYFQKAEIRFFHLFSLLAVPLRNSPAFNPVLGFLEKIDSLVLRMPGIKWLAWQFVFVLSEPKK